MCNFLSGIGFPDGTIKTSDTTDSHELQIIAFGLNEHDDLTKNGWVRYEYTVDNQNDVCDITKYRLKIDQDIMPDWLTGEITESWERKSNQLVKGMILSGGEIPILLGGKWVLGKNVVVKSVVNSIIVSMCDNSSVKNMYDNSSVKYMYGNSSVINMHGNSSVKYMYDNSSVKYMYGNSSVINMCDNSSVKNDNRNKNRNGYQLA